MTKNMHEPTKSELESQLINCEVQVKSPYNDGWTINFYNDQAKEIRQKLKDLNG